MFSKISINSSSKSSASSAFKVGDVVKKWEGHTIASCVLGMSKINLASEVINKISHSALLLLNTNLDYEDDDDEKIQKELGILIEYGDYKPDMCDTEKNYVKNGYVIYHYGEKGGLRYYGKKYCEFINEFGTKGYVDLNIHVDKQISFKVFLETIAKSEDNKWINDNYSAMRFNCQNFTIEALKLLQPSFSFANINPKSDELNNKKSFKQKLKFLPDNIYSILLPFYEKS